MSEHIKRWQQHLKWNHEYQGRIDGIFGPKTYEASLKAAGFEDVPNVPVIDRIGDTQLIIGECRRQGLLRNQTAYVLATAYWETARTMKPVVEAYWLSEEWRRNNLRYWPWHGRGYIQLTWESGYRRARDELGVDFVADPDLALRPEYAVEILVTGMREGWFTGKKLSDYITREKSDFVGARRIVNGTDKAAAIAAIAEDYDRDLAFEGYGTNP